MAKSVKIIEIVRDDGSFYTVDAIPAGLQDEVKEIKFHGSTDLYNKGRNIEEPCYVVIFKESNMKRLVPQSKVYDIGVEVTEKQEQKVESPEEVGLGGTATVNTDQTE